MKKILLLWPYFHPDKYGIACALRGEAFAKYLNKKESIEVSVVSPIKDRINNMREFEGCKTYRIRTYNTIGASYPFIISLLYLPFSILNLLIKIKKLKPDLIIASTPGPFLPLEGLIVARFIGVPFIFDMEDSWHLTGLSHKGRIKNNIKMYLERLCATHADMIFTVTPTLKKMIRDGYDIADNKIKVVYNGVDLEQFPALEKHEEIDLIHLGSPRIYYDTIRLIDAFSIIVDKLPNTQLRFIGCTDEDYVKKVRKYVVNKRLSKNVEFTTLISHEEVPYELAKAKIGMISLIDCPEYRSAIGVKVFEYMAAGLPTAYLGPSGEQENLIRKDNVGIYSSNPEELGKKIIDLLKNREIREELGKNAIRSIKNFSWENLIDETYEHYIKQRVGNNA